MFDTNLSFTGRHADEMRKLAPSKRAGEQEKQGMTLFQRYVDILPMAAVVGFLWKRRSEMDDAKEKEIPPANIFLEQLNQVSDDLEFAYRLIMLLHDKASVPLQERMNRAFRYDSDAEKRKAGDIIFFSYVRGGIDVLYENILQGSTSTDEDVQKLYEFVQETHDLHGKNVSIDDIIALSREAAV